MPKIARGRGTGASRLTSSGNHERPSTAVAPGSDRRSSTVSCSCAYANTRSLPSSLRTSPARGVVEPGGRKVVRRICREGYCRERAMAGMTPFERSALLAIAVLTAAAGVANYDTWSAVPRFALAPLALAGLAWVVSFATEQLGERFGPGVTGMMQSTLGNLPELFVVIFALQKGELIVAQTAIVGSILANALLVLGLVIVVGARRAPDGMMRFSKRLPRDTATLLQVTVFIIVLLGLSLANHDPASHHVKAISIVGAICLLVVYMAWVVPYLRSDKAPGAEDEPAGERSAAQTPARAAARLREAGLRGARARGAACVVRADAGAADRGGDGVGVRVGLVHQRPRARDHDPAHLPGVRRPRDRRDRRQRRGEHRRARALVQAPLGPRHLSRQKLRRADRRLPVPCTRARVLRAKHHAHVRARARLHRRAGAHRARPVAGDRRR